MKGFQYKMRPYDKSLLGEDSYKTPQVFYAVWRMDGGSAPTKRHDSMTSATLEANRLAVQTGDKFYVLKVVGIVAPPETPINYKPL